MMTVDEVPRWIVSCGIGHAVSGIGGGWAYTACSSMISADLSNTTAEKPRRICRACREMLSVATPVRKVEAVA